jgi:putative transcriptional regulator
MTPTHHLPPEALLGYATGIATPGTALLTACHLTLCPVCRREVSRLEALGGAMLESLPKAEMPATVFSSTLARLDEIEPAATSSPARVSPAPDVSEAPMPAPIFQVLLSAPGSAQIPWRQIAPGIRGASLMRTVGGGSARLFDLRGGTEIPMHDHEGDEYGLVLRGSAASDGVPFFRGDVITAETGQRHALRTGPGQRCVSLVVNEGPIRPLNWRGRVLKVLLGD